MNKIKVMRSVGVLFLLTGMGLFFIGGKRTHAGETCLDSRPKKKWSERKHLRFGDLPKDFKLPTSPSIDAYIVDLKLPKINGKKMVKILELGSFFSSGFTGYNALYGEDAIIKNLSLKINEIDWLSHTCVLDKTGEPRFVKKLGRGEEEPVFLNKNKVLENIADDKFLTNSLFVGDLELYRPKWKLVPIQKDESEKADLAKLSHLVHEINTEVNAKKYIIKPLGLARGEGIFVFERNDLEEVLKLVLGLSEDEGGFYRALSEETKKAWTILFHNKCRSKNAFFLVEEYVASEPIKVMKKDKKNDFDATMRVVFILTNDKKGTKDSIGVKFIGEYWKLPKNPIGSSEDSYISQTHGEGDIVNSKEVSDLDKKIVHEQLEKILPEIYKKVLSINDIKQKLLASPDNTEQVYGEVFLEVDRSVWAMTFPDKKFIFLNILAEQGKLTEEKVKEVLNPILNSWDNMYEKDKKYFAGKLIASGLFKYPAMIEWFKTRDDRYKTSLLKVALESDKFQDKTDDIWETIKETLSGMENDYHKYSLLEAVLKSDEFQDKTDDIWTTIKITLKGMENDSYKDSLLKAVKDSKKFNEQQIDELEEIEAGEQESVPMEIDQHPTPPVERRPYCSIL